MLHNSLICINRVYTSVIRRMTPQKFFLLLSSLINFLFPKFFTNVKIIIEKNTCCNAKYNFFLIDLLEIFLKMSNILKSHVSFSLLFAGARRLLSLLPLVHESDYLKIALYLFINFFFHFMQVDSSDPKTSTFKLCGGSRVLVR